MGRVALRFARLEHTVLQQLQHQFAVGTAGAAQLVERHLDFFFHHLTLQVGNVGLVHHTPKAARGLKSPCALASSLQACRAAALSSRGMWICSTT